MNEGLFACPACRAILGHLVLCLGKCDMFLPFINSAQRAKPLLYLISFKMSQLIYSYCIKLEKNIDITIILCLCRTCQLSCSRMQTYVLKAARAYFCTVGTCTASIYLGKNIKAFESCVHEWTCGSRSYRATVLCAENAASMETAPAA